MMSAPPLCQSDKPFAGQDHGIAFEDVRFAYGQDEVLHGVSLSAAEGSLTALVGDRAAANPRWQSFWSILRRDRRRGEDRRPGCAGHERRSAEQ